MRSLLLEWVRELGGVATRSELVARFAVHVIDDAVRARALEAAHPGVYCLVGAMTEIETRRRAALAYCPGGALSHTDALDQWNLPTLASTRVHITISGGKSAALSPGVCVHRRRNHRMESPLVVMRRGLATVRVEQAIVDSWPLLPSLMRRAPAIVAVRERLTTVDRLIDVLNSQRCVGAREQRQLYAQLGAGHQSELEIWGHAKVFTDRRLPRSLAQHRLEVGDRYVILDRAFLPEMTAVELDGAAYHGAPGQRERDIRRDAAVAKLGWLTVRFSHQRLHGDPDGVIEELGAILRRRRSQLTSATPVGSLSS